jgi:hypothetical protein
MAMIASLQDLLEIGDAVKGSMNICIIALFEQILNQI